MNLGVRSMVVLAGLIAAHGMLAQAPAGAPAGSNGVCKDGSYSTAATKDGACRGHKGVQTWYGATTTKAAKPSTSAAAKSASPAPVAASASMPAKPSAQVPAPMPAAAAKPAVQGAAPMASATPAQSNSSMAKPSATRVSETKGDFAAKQAAPGGGNGLVWVNTATNVYHCSGTAYYGKTKAGAYMSESDAKAKGARADAGKPCMK